MVTTPTICKTCGEPFIGHSRGRLGPRIYCSRRCRSRDPEFQAKISVNKTGRYTPKLPIDGTVERLYAEGLSNQTIGDQFGVAGETVRQFLVRRDVVMRPRAVQRVFPPAKPQRAVVSTEEIARLYVAGSSLAELATRYSVARETISARLRAAGITIRRSFYGSEVPYRCEDGHLVKSRYEQVVDDWLWAHRLAHAYEPSLAFSSDKHGDFLVADIYIEVWGVVGRADYDDRKHRKLAEYADAGLSVISLYPRHIMNELDRHLSVLLAP